MKSAKRHLEDVLKDIGAIGDSDPIRHRKVGLRWVWQTSVSFVVNDGIRFMISYDPVVPKYSVVCERLMRSDDDETTDMWQLVLGDPSYAFTTSETSTLTERIRKLIADSHVK